VNSDGRAKLDTLAIVETPEGVELALRAAGPAVRSLAWMIDVLVVGALLIACMIVAGLLGATGAGLALLGMFALSWGYDLTCELRWGATPGKRALGLRVVRIDGTPVTWVDSALRNLLRFADLLPFAYGIGLCSCLASRRFQRLGDHVAGTLVVYDASSAARVRRRAAEAAEPYAPPFALASDEQRAVIDFAERSTGLSPARCVELAEIVEPLVGARGDLARRRLLGVAAWVRGEA
jgi:uncharacterized RDD family membrane protein YckC